MTSAGLDAVGAREGGEDLRGLDRGAVTFRTQELLEVMGLTDAEQTLIADYSTGMRKKIGLASALLHAHRGWCSTSPSRPWTRYRRRS